MTSEKSKLSTKAVSIRATSDDTDLSKLEQEVAYYQEMVRIKEMEKRRLVEKKKSMELLRGGTLFSQPNQNSADFE